MSFDGVLTPDKKYMGLAFIFQYSVDLPIIDDSWIGEMFMFYNSTKRGFGQRGTWFNIEQIPILVKNKVKYWWVIT